MKKVIFSSFLATLFLVVACNSNKKPALKDADMNSVEAPIVVAQSEEAANDTLVKLFSSNIDKYPTDIHLFENDVFMHRLRALTGNYCDSIIKYFNVESPLKEEDGILMFMGGKAHAVPVFQTFVIFDTKNNNMNVEVHELSHDTLFVEADTIHVTESLRKK